jgi:IS30 family transposase
MTTVGLIGSGNIGITVAQVAIEAGHQVVLSNSRGPETLTDTVAQLGPRAAAATSEQAAAAGDIIVVTVPVKAFPNLPAAPLAGKTIIDTCNYGPERDGHIPELDSNALTSSELLLRYIPDATDIDKPGTADARPDRASFPLPVREGCCPVRVCPPSPEPNAAESIDPAWAALPGCPSAVSSAVGWCSRSAAWFGPIVMVACIPEGCGELGSNSWSPQQIAGWLRRRFPTSTVMQVSHETIYRTLFVQARGELRHELTGHLRTRRAMRRPTGARLPDGRGTRPNFLTISQRPAEAADRAVPGHGEGDLVFGRGMSPVATLVERVTRFLMLVALPEGHRAELVADALAAKIQTLLAVVARTLTWDQGHEMAAHARFTIATGVDVFCDPKSPWQRGTNENTNGLLRQYLTRTVSMRDYSQADFDAIADELNGRPRQILGFRTPYEALARVLR